MPSVKAIVLPVRPQPDTLVAIFLLKRFGKEKFPGVETAPIETWQVLPEGKAASEFEKEGYILIDLDGGMFDHHNIRGKAAASQLVADYLGITEDPSIAKLIEYAKRDDFFGKGTVSEDQLDRTFGLSGIVAVLNKSLPNNSQRVVDIILPILAAHHNEEIKRTTELPKEFEEKVALGEVATSEVKQRGKKLRIVFINSGNPSMAGYLRSQGGGKFDVVAQKAATGHVNILTRSAKHIDLRSLAMVLRLEELTLCGTEAELTAIDLSRTGRLKEVPNWYYDRATNSIQNGGVNPKDIEPTAILWEKMPELFEVGLSERVWSPIDNVSKLV